MKKIINIILLILIVTGKPIIGFSQKTNIEIDQKISTLNLKENATLFVEANKEKNLGNLKKAEDLYKRCIELVPDDAASMYELATIYLMNNEIESAKKLAESTVKIDTTNIWYKLLLSNIYKIDKSYQKSVEVLEDLSRQNPENLEYTEELAQNYIIIGEYEKAIKALNTIENKIGVTEQLAIQKQKLYQNLNQVESGIGEIEKLIHEFPTEARYYALLAELCLKNDLDEKALNAYKQITELDPENPYIHISLSDFYRKSGDTLRAFQELKTGFENDQLDIDSKIQILVSYYTVEQIFSERNKEAEELVSLLANKYPENSRIHSIKSEILFQARDFIKAKESLLKAISIDSTLFGSWEQLLITESALSDFKAMAEHSRKVIELFPDRPLAYLFSGLVNFQNKNYEEAISYYKKGLVLVQSNAALSVQFYSFLGDAYHELDNNTDSDQAYESALKLDPENSVVLNNYAYYLALRSEKLDQAKRMSFKAVDLDPENASNLDTKAWVLYKMKLFEEAKIVIERAMEIGEQNSAEVYEHYGDILFQLGDIKKAVKFWKMARKKGSESEWINKKIKEKKLYE
ncbi:MAG: tetratricopeptide repeat protein [Bacteroidetes bacterium]|nr:tetratricopeptide repeat protein [Bacteroidota bacterium]